MSNNKLNKINKTGFKTPDDYFESLEDTIMSKLHNDKVLKDIKDSGYKVPDTYFKSLEDTIIAKLPNNKPTKVISFFSKRNIAFISSIAAVIMIMFGIFYNTTNDNFDSLDTDLVETYLQNQDLNTYELAALFTEEELTETDFGISNANYTEQSLEDYLLDNANLEDLIE